MSNPQEASPSQTVENLSIPYVADKLTGNLTIEDPTDQQHRLEQKAYYTCHKRWRTNFIILVTVCGLGFIFYLCYLTLSDSTASANDKRWATVFVSSIVTGSVGFLTGKAVS